MPLLDRESFALAVSKPSPLLPPCSHGFQSEGSCRTLLISQPSQWQVRGPRRYENPFLMGRGLAVGVEEWDSLHGRLRLVHHADSAGPVGLVEKCSLAVKSSAGTTNKWIV